MAETQRVLVTGPTGKVGQAFIRRFLSEPKFEGFVVRAVKGLSCSRHLLTGETAKYGNIILKKGVTPLAGK